MDYSDLKSANPKLYADGVARGIIPSSQISTNLSWGANASSPMVESFMGGPHAPVVGQFNPDSGIPLGISGAYPKPWMSAAQRTTQAGYTYAGPFARMIGYVTCGEGESEYSNNCLDETCTPDQRTQPPLANQPIGGGEGIWGRVGQIQSGSLAGQAGFYPQNWHDQDPGTNDADFWNVQADPDRVGNEQWTSRPEWWAECEKQTIIVYSTWDLWSPKVEVEVATGFLDFTSTSYFQGNALWSVAGMSTTVLTTMVATAALLRWGF